MCGREDPLLGDDGAAAEHIAGAGLHEAHLPGVLVRGRLLTADDPRYAKDIVFFSTACLLFCGIFIICYLLTYI